jgi:hypothetical protein
MRFLAGMLFAVALGSTGATRCGDGRASVQGCWVVSRPLSVPGVSALSPAETQSFVGRRVCYQNDELISGDARIRGLTYQSTVLAYDEFIAAHKFRPEELGIGPAPSIAIIVVEVKDPSSDYAMGLGRVYFSGKNLVVSWEGQYFELVKERGASRGAIAR